jgi:Family of unknown function (DUF5343)
MALPASYTLKPGAIPEYFEAMLNADAPKRVSSGFLESLEFKSSNDRLFIGVLRDLGFVDSDGAPTPRYFEFLDRSQSRRAVAAGVKDAYSDLFAIQRDAQNLTAEDVKNKLRTLYKGTKKDNLIARIASTFVALCQYADFSQAHPPSKVVAGAGTISAETAAITAAGSVAPQKTDGLPPQQPQMSPSHLLLDGLQYHINIVLPDSRDQAVYDAIFKSLRDHLGPRNG